MLEGITIVGVEQDEDAACEKKRCGEYHHVLLCLKRARIRGKGQNDG